MDTIELVICKAVVTESFPERGWIGVVAPDERGKHLHAIYTRGELYQEVKRIMEKYGEDFVRPIIQKFKVPEGYAYMFASSKDAVDENHAKKLIEQHIH